MVGFNNIHFVTNVEKNRRNEPFLITEKFMGFFFSIFKMYGPFLTISQNVGTKNIFNPIVFL
jgi:hypothetical protein